MITVRLRRPLGPGERLHLVSLPDGIPAGSVGGDIGEGVRAGQAFTLVLPRAVVQGRPGELRAVLRFRLAPEGRFLDADEMPEVAAAN